MTRILLLVIGAYYFANGLFMMAAPENWYQLTPGVSMTGPYNWHFIIDIALIYMISGAASMWGSWNNNLTSIFVGLSWPVSHAVFHIYVWVERGAPADLIALANLAGIQLPAWIGLLILAKYQNAKPSQ
ncbi:hypothetical protein [Pseudovibrio japonicus]|nr:hypothetical protein [Pseudovibrio japonicus]